LQLQPQYNNDFRSVYNNIAIVIVVILDIFGHILPQYQNSQRNCIFNRHYNLKLWLWQYIWPIY